jgi:hypothetical protein
VGAHVDRVVAAALARRATDDAGPRHATGGDERRTTPVGWPGRPDDGTPGGSPVGWPGSMTAEPAEEPAREPAAEPVPERPRGWRRLLGRAA